MHWEYVRMAMYCQSIINYLVIDFKPNPQLALYKVWLQRHESLRASQNEPERRALVQNTRPLWMKQAVGAAAALPRHQPCAHSPLVEGRAATRPANVC